MAIGVKVKPLSFSRTVWPVGKVANFVIHAGFSHAGFRGPKSSEQLSLDSLPGLGAPVIDYAFDVQIIGAFPPAGKIVHIVAFRFGIGAINLDAGR